MCSDVCLLDAGGDAVVGTFVVDVVTRLDGRLVTEPLLWRSSGDFSMGDVDVAGVPDDVDCAVLAGV